MRKTWNEMFTVSVFFCRWLQRAAYTVLQKRIFVGSTDKEKNWLLPIPFECWTKGSMDKSNPSKELCALHIFTCMQHPFQRRRFCYSKKGFKSTETQRPTKEEDFETWCCPFRLSWSPILSATKAIHTTIKKSNIFFTSWKWQLTFDDSDGLFWGRRHYRFFVIFKN